MKETIKDIIRKNNTSGDYPLADIAAAEILALFNVSKPFYCQQTDVLKDEKQRCKEQCSLCKQ